jgi:predicted ArsR family transcriptional regulator
VLSELCGHPQTAAEVAARVGTSANAVRAHLESLRDAGLVDYCVERRGVGKPRHVYAMTSAAEALLSSAYEPTLEALLELLARRRKSDFRSLLRALGSVLGARAAAGASKRRPLAVAAATLESFGAPVTISTRSGERIIGNQCCPLAGVARRTPEICEMMESLLQAASGLRLQARCERGSQPRCSFAASRRVRV